MQNNANAVRSNHPLGEVVTPISTYLQGIYGYDNNGQTVYEPREQHKGDAARALLYMSLRYDGVSGFNWTFNNLNNSILPSLNEDPQNLATLLQWHNQDPPDNYEIARNDYVQSIQQNRNPFVDHPDWVNYINFNDLSWIANPGKTDDGWQSNPLSAMRVTVFPNPMHDAGFVYVETDRQQTALMSVIDVYGRTIYTQTIDLQSGINATALELSQLSTGYYFLVITTEKGNVTKRFIVE